ncbi:MAG TPA: hypothetical protein VFG30_25595 [Polyangiales bacterium]|nr:hypothetical protein [Polyangiales bacterium]
MAKAKNDWKVLWHGPLVKLAENLWWVQGAIPNMSLKRTMVVARLADGRLVIHNAIALGPQEMEELERWGRPAFLLVPNGMHRMDAPAYKKRYPDLRVLCPSGARAKVAEVVDVDGTYNDFPPDDSVRLEMLKGIGDSEGAMIVSSADGQTVVLNDAMFNMDRKRDPLGFLITTLLGSAPGPRVSRLAKLAFVKDKSALRSDFARYADLPGLVRVIVAHEKIASGPSARESLQTAMQYL